MLEGSLVRGILRGLLIEEESIMAIREKIKEIEEDEEEELSPIYDEAEARMILGI